MKRTKNDQLLFNSIERRNETKKYVKYDSSRRDVIAIIRKMHAEDVHFQPQFGILMIGWLAMNYNQCVNM